MKMHKRNPKTCSNRRIEEGMICGNGKQKELGTPLSI